MTEQEKQIRNHFLTLFIGECFHKWEKPDNLGDRLCKYCLTWEHDVSNGHKTVTNPDFYQPNDFHRLRKWMEENEAKLWRNYLDWCDEFVLNTGGVMTCLMSNELLNKQLNPSNLFEFLKEHREKWEWVKCPVMDGGDCIENCEIDQHKQVAETGCKVRHPAAIYLDKEAKMCSGLSGLILGHDFKEITTSAL